MAAAPKGVGGLGGWNLQTKRYRVNADLPKHPARGLTTIWDQWGQTTWRNRETGRHHTTAEIDDLVVAGKLIELDGKGNPVPPRVMTPPKKEAADAA